MTFEQINSGFSFLQLVWVFLRIESRVFSLNYIPSLKNSLICLFVYLLIFETVSLCSSVSLELTILLPQSPKYQDHRHALLTLVCKLTLIPVNTHVGHSGLPLWLKLLRNLRSSKIIETRVQCLCVSIAWQILSQNNTMQSKNYHFFLLLDLKLFLELSVVQ